MYSEGAQPVIRKSKAWPSAVWARKVAPAPCRCSLRNSMRVQAVFQRPALAMSARAAQTSCWGAAMVRGGGAAMVRETEAVGMALPQRVMLSRAGWKDGGVEGVSIWR